MISNKKISISVVCCFANHFSGKQRNSKPISLVKRFYNSLMHTFMDFGIYALIYQSVFLFQFYFRINYWSNESSTNISICLSKDFDVKVYNWISAPIYSQKFQKLHLKTEILIWKPTLLFYNHTEYRRQKKILLHFQFLET